jgi:hypothetical protein
MAQGVWHAGKTPDTDGAGDWGCSPVSMDWTAIGRQNGSGASGGEARRAIYRAAAGFDRPTDWDPAPSVVEILLLLRLDPASPPSLLYSHLSRAVLDRFRAFLVLPAGER